jgi:hypothetical protein
MRPSQQPAIGVIAQDVEKVFPELVTTDERGYKQVAYYCLIAPLIEAVKTRSSTRLSKPAVPADQSQDTVRWVSSCARIGERQSPAR